jgi:hypothetical protein
MDSKELSESSIVARLIVAVVALSSLAAGTTIVGSVIEITASTPASTVRATQASR